MIQPVKIDGIDNEHPAKAVYGMVSDIMTDLGYDIDLIAELSGNPDIHGRKVGITLQMSTDVDKLIRDGRFPFSLQKNLKGHFGISEGSANVTTVRLEKQMNIREVLEHFDKTGQLSDAVEAVEFEKTAEDPDSEIILGYALAQYAKGWIAEEIAQEQIEGLKKGSVSHDEGGIDFYLNGDMSQLGSITRYNSRKTEMEGSDIRHLLYQWHSDGSLVVGDIEEILEFNSKMAKEVGLSSTLTKRSHGGLKINETVGRSFRYLWW
jgi:hypothetical protein